MVLPVPARVQPRLAVLGPSAEAGGRRSLATWCVYQEGTASGAGVDYGPVYLETQARPLPHLDARMPDGPRGHGLSRQSGPQSLDGRYLGMTPVVTLTAQATPLLTWR